MEGRGEKKKRQGNASSNLASDTRHRSNGGGAAAEVAQSHSVNTPPPICLPLPSLKTSFPPIPSLSSFSSSYFPTKVGGSSFRTNNKSRLASTYRRRGGGALSWACAHTTFANTPFPGKGPFHCIESISIIIMPVRGKGDDVPPGDSTSSIWRAPRTPPTDTTLLLFRLCGGEILRRGERGLERSIISSSPWETPSERGEREDLLRYVAA